MNVFFVLLLCLVGCFCPLPCLLLGFVVLAAKVLAVPSKLSVINLQTKQTHCDCGGKLVSKNRSTSVTIYTRFGTQQGLHHEYRYYFIQNQFIFISRFISRCSRKTCQTGYYFGYSTKQSDKFPKGIKYWYEDDCLENQYLVTSQETWYNFLDYK